MEWRNGKKAAEEMRSAQLRGSYQMLRMTGGADAPANRPTTAFSSNVEYAALIYGKAPLLYDAWRAKLGDEQWFSTLRAYVEENRYRWATSKTLLGLAGRKNPGHAADLAALQRRWWEERHGDEDVGGGLGEQLGVPGDLGDVGSPGGLSKEAWEQLNKLMDGRE